MENLEEFYAERVRLGAAWLALNAPVGEWWSEDRLILAALDMGDPGSCIIGQVMFNSRSSAAYRWFNEGADEIGIDVDDLGFDVSARPGGRELAAFTDGSRDLARRYELLRLAWVEYVDRLRSL